MRHRQFRPGAIPGLAERGLGLGLIGVGSDLDRPLTRGAAGMAERHRLRRVGRGNQRERAARRRWRHRREARRFRLRGGHPNRLRRDGDGERRGYDRPTAGHPARSARRRELRVAAIAQTRRDADRQVVHRVGLSRRRGLRPGGLQIRPDHRDVAAGFVRQRPVVGKVVVQTRRAGIVGGEEPGGPVDVVHFPHVGDAGHDVVMRIERIVAEVMTYPQLVVGARHDLHQAHGAGPGRDQLPILVLPATGFHPHQ